LININRGRETEKRGVFVNGGSLKKKRNNSFNLSRERWWRSTGIRHEDFFWGKGK